MFMTVVLDVEDPSVAAARRGDSLAWADLYERYHPVIERYLEVVDPEALADSDDIWVRAAHTLPAQPEGLEPLIWLLRTARDGKIARPSPEDSDDLTIRVIRSLSPIEMDVIALRVIAGLAEEDVALVIGRPIERVRAAAHRGVSRLVERLGPS